MEQCSGRGISDQREERWSFGQLKFAMASGFDCAMHCPNRRAKSVIGLDNMVSNIRSFVYSTQGRVQEKEFISLQITEDSELYGLTYGL